jgi:MscS family membrane protein
MSMQRLVLASCLLFTAQAFAQLPGMKTSPEPAVQAESDPYRRETPRGTVQGFVYAAQHGRFRRAAEFLEVPDAERAARGAELARELQAVFDQRLFINVDRLSSQPEGQLDDQLPPDRELVGYIETPEERADVLLKRVPTQDGRKIWLISAETLKQAPLLYRQVGHPEIESLLPEPLVRTRWFNVAAWQWLAFAALIPVAMGISWVLVFILRRASRAVRPKPAQERRRQSALPALLTIAIVIHFFSVSGLGLPLLYRIYYNRVLSILLYSMMVWLGFRWIDGAAENVQKRLAGAGKSAANSLLLLGRRVVKVAVVITVALVALRTLGFNLGGLLAGLGIGGVALAFAAQKTLENLFGGVSVLSDRAIRVGDFCRIGAVTGSIEDIGLRSTRVRTLDRSVVFVPNGLLATVNLENLAHRDKYWFHPILNLRYETTAEQLRRVLTGVREMLNRHTKIDSETLRVRFTTLGAYSLDVEVFAYVFAQDYPEYLAVQEDLLLRIMDIVEAAGTGFAFPSQTMYVARDGGRTPAPPSSSVSATS